MVSVYSCMDFSVEVRFITVRCLQHPLSVWPDLASNSQNISRRSIFRSQTSDSNSIIMLLVVLFNLYLVICMLLLLLNLLFNRFLYSFDSFILSFDLLFDFGFLVCFLSQAIKDRYLIISEIFRNLNDLLYGWLVNFSCSIRLS